MIVNMNTGPGPVPPKKNGNKPAPAAPRQPVVKPNPKDNMQFGSGQVSDFSVSSGDQLQRMSSVRRGKA